MKTKLLLFLASISFGTYAQTAPSYGNNITLDNARKVAAAAEAYAVKNQWNVAIVIVDTGGSLVLVHKLDNTQIGSIQVAIEKAKTSNGFKRPTKAFEDGVAGGGVGLRVLSLPGDAVAIEGGELILSEGKIVGAIGVSGVQANQDGEVARAGAAALK